MTALQITPRPYTSPCAQCSGEIPEELNTAAFAQADDPAKTVCDACAKRTAPDAYQALYDLRRIDTQFWAIWNRDGWPYTRNDTACEAARVYLATLLEGAAALYGMYFTPGQTADVLSRLTEAAQGDPR